MELDGDTDLSAWTAKPPSKPVVDEEAADNEEVPQANGDARSDSNDSRRQSSPQPSVVSSIEGDINYDGTRAEVRFEEPSFPGFQENEDSDSDDDVVEVSTLFRHGFYIDVPPLSDEEKQQYHHLPGHFEVDEILTEAKNGHFIVRLVSGEKQKLVSHSEFDTAYIVSSLQCIVRVTAQRCDFEW